MAGSWRQRLVSSGILGCLLAIPVASIAQNSVAVGDVIVDPPTVASLGFSVPIVSGDDDYDASATVSYRQSGAVEWLEAMPLLRVRPETISQESPPEDFGFVRPGEQFAGSIFFLDAATQYEVRIDVVDPDGGDRSQVVNVATRSVPRGQPVTPRVVEVASAAEFDIALQSAAAGDVITLAPGTYAGRFDLDGRDGTADNPIIIRGPAENSIATIDGSGQSVALSITNASHVHVEYLRITGVSGIQRYGLRLSGDDLVARHLTIDTDNGIDASNHLNRGIYICDNELNGPTNWPGVAVDANVNEKNWIGINIRGRGHTVCHNTLNNYGSTIWVGYRGLSNPTHTISVDFNNNDVGWSADDGIELDGSTRNIRVWENRVHSALMGISFQPVWGGPVYAIRNVVYNTAAAPFKLNNDPSGVMLWHNTILRYAETDIFGPYDGNAWPQLGESSSYAANTKILNNIMVGNDDALFLRQEMPLMQLDYNGYSPDGSFGLQVGGVVQSYPDLAGFVAGTGFEPNGVVLSSPLFAAPPPASADYRPLFAPPDFTLAAQSNAIDAGLSLPNVNDGSVGSAPDLGAIESGAPAPVYGRRDIDTMPPAAPTDLTITVP